MCPGCGDAVPVRTHGRGRQWKFCSYNCRMRDWRKSNKSRVKDHARKTLYGLMPGQYEEMLTSQGGKCDICSREDKLFIDHSHATGKVRKLLCHKCNSALGLFEENTAFLEQAIAYLKRNT